MNYFQVNWNILGEQPDEESLLFDKWDDAVVYLTDHISFMIEDDESLYNEGVVAINTLVASLPPASISVVVGPFVMYIMSSSDLVSI